MTMKPDCDPANGAPRFSVCSSLVMFCLLVGAGGCGEANSPQVDGSMSFHDWDSAGIRVVETSGNGWEALMPWEVGSAPELELGRIDGGGPTQFHRIRGLTVVSGDRLVVVDAGSREIRWFDRAGQHLLTMGGEGDGPGEFNNPLLVPQYEGDSLLVFDTSARRFTWVAEDGSGYRMQRTPENRQLTAGAASAAGGSKVLFRSGSVDCILEELCESSLFMRWVDLSEGTSDTIVAFPRWSARRANREGIPHILPGPFDPVGVTAVDAEGPVVGGRSELEFRRFDAAGDLVGVFRIDAPMREVDDDAIERAIAPYSDWNFDADVVRRIFGEMDLPDAMPAFQSLVVDQLGWYWAERFRLDDADPWMWVVFDPEGKAQGMIEMPEGLEVHEIGEDYILGRWVDELGVEFVQRYGLRRNEG